MTLYVTEHNFFNSKFFLWVDIGSFRWKKSPYEKWPDVDRLEKIFAGRESMVLVGNIRKPNRLEKQNWWRHVTSKGRVVDEYGNIAGRTYVQGTFFVGMASGIQWFAREFYRVRDNWLERGYFAGEDQHIMTAVVGLN
eukprot:TRINITY_DN518_c0_g1_i1.p2 TRINITY_DN518_c0_g1~~TRINITY_DN518_c0_g1_i1.p2  ORF type:complete len:138 (+),score=14.60 TRINITY_DN518_c0_g1_i1:1586-1999(+)